MSDAAPPNPLEPDVIVAEMVDDVAVANSGQAEKLLPPWLRPLDRWMEAASDRLNPILVKEARQSLKSKQFLITFSLLLIAGLIWSLLGVALLGYDGGYYAPGGRNMLIGYFWIMTFPLIVVVPFAAFRSLAGEKEDGTYELLSITTLSPRQVIWGKLGSAILQIMIYLSALAPCIAFTYLLRGVDVLFLVFLIGYTVLISILLCQLSLLWATLVTSRQTQVILSVVLVIGLAIVFYFPTYFVADELIDDGEVLPYDKSGFWIANAAWLTAAASAFTLMFLAATANVTAWTENRSTNLRIAMAVIHLVFLGWCAALWAHIRRPEEVLVFYVSMSMVFFWIVGAMLVGERSEMSPRVRRTLPQTGLGRMFIGWFYPGSTSGFLFAVANVVAVAVIGIQMAMLRWPSNNLRFDEYTQFVMAFGFTIVMYLGAGRLVLRLIERKLSGPIVGLFVGAILVFLGSFIPFVLGVALASGRYSVMHFTNPFWTLDQAFSRRLGPELFVLGAMALLMLLLNLIAAGNDISLNRAKAPQRIIDEEKLNEPEPVPQRTSPWD